VSDEGQRRAVQEQAWRRFSAWSSAALLAAAGTWLAGRSRLSGREVSGVARGLTLAKDALVGGALGLAAANVVVGEALATARRETSEVAAARPHRVQRLHTAARVLGSVQLGVIGGILAVTSMLAMEGGRSLRWTALSRWLP
jgi:hypothetical protein